MWIIEWFHAGAAECYCITRKARDLSKWKFHQAGFPGWNLFSTDCAGIRRLRTAGTCRAPRRGKRVDTKVSTLLTPTSFYFVVRRRPENGDRFEKGERQSGYHSVSFVKYSQFTDSLLLHRWFHLRRRDIPVSHNSFIWRLWTAPANCTYLSTPISSLLTPTLHQLFTLHSSL